MPNKQVCFVLGAGASAPYGFPTGSDMLTLVGQPQADDWWPLAKDTLGRDCRQVHDDFVAVLKDAPSPSIDHLVQLRLFIHYHQCSLSGT